MKIEKRERIDFINATGEELLIIRALKSLGEALYRILNCMGEETENGTVDLDVGLHGFNVPKCGMLQLF